MRDQLSGKCAIEHCDEPTALDWAQFRFNGRAFCSPDCARKGLEQMDEVPTTITFLDPQGVAYRSAFSGVEPEDPTMMRSVRDVEDARAAIAEIEEQFPGKFRPSLSDGER